MGPEAVLLDYESLPQRVGASSELFSPVDP